MESTTYFERLNELTPCENAICELLLTGLQVKEVGVHISNVYSKLNLHTRMDLYNHFRGMLRPPEEEGRPIPNA